MGKTKFRLTGPEDCRRCGLSWETVNGRWCAWIDRYVTYERSYPCKTGPVRTDGRTPAEIYRDRGNARKPKGEPRLEPLDKQL